MSRHQEQEKAANLYSMEPIGIIHTPWKDPASMPIQPAGAAGARGRIVVEPRFAEGLDDLEGFSHVILIYLFHCSRGYALQVEPFLDDRPRGLFSTRAPRRPNPIGLSTVRLAGRDGAVLEVIDIDVLDGTPLLDIKPYVPAFDAPAGEIRTGWLAGRSRNARQTRSDGRFK